ncbi:hypothetical protein F4677DRAFT_433215 [Hypoxylon crocopeplum]|nr:hypothetical protein F4677DRAFT_433215 [Hypoxylon crocopeplum]
MNFGIGGFGVAWPLPRFSSFFLARSQGVGRAGGYTHSAKLADQGLGMPPLYDLLLFKGRYARTNRMLVAPFNVSDSTRLHVLELSLSWSWSISSKGGGLHGFGTWLPLGGRKNKVKRNNTTYVNVSSSEYVMYGRSIPFVIHSREPCTIREEIKRRIGMRITFTKPEGFLFFSFISMPSEQHVNPDNLQTNPKWAGLEERAVTV